MIQTVLMFLAPDGAAPERSRTAPPGFRPMATFPARPLERRWKMRTGTVLAVLGNAVGLILLMAGIGVVLRLAEILAHQVFF